MANNYFQFKEFTILQEVCAMKVCTDSCLFGAWVTNAIKENAANNILDIGTGTGLLSLMLAQQYPTTNYHCIEIDNGASIEAKLNFDNSKWGKQFQVFNQDFKSYKATVKYDLIICNPPFYNNQLVSPDNKRNAAMHSSEFSLEELFIQSSKLIADNGQLACLIPYNRTAETLNIMADTGWFVEKVAYVKQTNDHDFFRTMLLCKKTPQTIDESVISIKNNQQYTNEFIDLLRAYYLFL